MKTSTVTLADGRVIRIRALGHRAKQAARAAQRQADLALVASGTIDRELEAGLRAIAAGTAGRGPDYEYQTYDRDTVIRCGVLTKDVALDDADAERLKRAIVDLG